MTTPAGDGAARPDTGPQHSAQVSTAGPGGRPRWWSPVPRHLGRARTSTVILSVLFLAIGALYLTVRPTDTATTTTGGGGSQPVPAAPATRTHPRTTAPRTSSVPATPTTSSGPTDLTTPSGRSSSVVPAPTTGSGVPTTTSSTPVVPSVPPTTSSAPTS